MSECLSFLFFLSLFFCLFSLILPVFLPLSVALSLSLSLSVTHFLSLSYSVSLCLSRSLTLCSCPFPPSLSVSLSLSVTLTFSLSLCLCLSVCLICSPTLTLSLLFVLPHCLSLLHSPTVLHPPLPPPNQAFTWPPKVLISKSETSTLVLLSIFFQGTKACVHMFGRQGFQRLLFFLLGHTPSSVDDFVSALAASFSCQGFVFFFTFAFAATHSLQLW